jgi:hypothetical protein
VSGRSVPCALAIAEPTSLSIKIEPTVLRLALDILKRESAQPAKPGASKISIADVDASA